MPDNRPLTRDEEADEIVRRLKTPPKKLPRVLKAKWTIDSLEDLGTTYGLDVEKEIMEALSKSIAEEIDKEIAIITECQKKPQFITTYSDSHLVKAITLPSLIIT